MAAPIADSRCCWTPTCCRWFLPLVIETRAGELALAVTDFRYASVPLEAVLAVNDAVRASVERQVCLTVEDFEVSAEEFGSLFSGYLKQH